MAYDEKRFVFLEKQLRSDEITVREQKDYRAKLREVGARMSSFSAKVQRIEEKIGELERQKHLIPNPGIK